MANDGLKHMCDDQVKRVPVSERVMEQLDQLVARAENVADFAEARLRVVAREDCPRISGESPLQESFPPLFHSYRAGLERIEMAVDRLYNILDRTEL